MLKLIGTDGQRLYAFELRPGSAILGRSADQPFHVPDKTVSRKHAQIELSPSGREVYITDAGSHNGTRVNGIKITERTRVEPGDKIMFGRTEFKVREEMESDSKVTRPTAAVLAESDPEKSVVLTINEALGALPAKVTDHPSLFPTLSEMARILVLSEPREAMLERALSLVNRVVPAERLAILLKAEDGEEVFVEASLLPGGRDPGSFTLSRTIVSDILSNRNAILLGDPSSDPRFAAQESIIMSQIRSAMAVPLFDADEVLGILYVDSTNPQHQYNNDYLRLLATFGNIIASRLLNYSLIDERQQKKVFEAELERASLIQQNLLIRDKPEIPNYALHAFQRQCRAVGGDLYDVAKLASGRTAVVVADVSGKGMGAALLMSNILASFRVLYNVTEFTIAQVVQTVSDELYSCSTPSDFATLFVGVLDPESHKFSYINAGHNPPIHIRQDGSFDHLEASGTMIGAFPGGMWEEKSVTLGPEDLILVFTDGVTEAERENQQYSEARLEETVVQSKGLEPEPLLEHLIKDIESFMGDAPRTDDITMLAIKRKA